MSSLESSSSFLSSFELGGVVVVGGSWLVEVVALGVLGGLVAVEVVDVDRVVGVAVLSGRSSPSSVGFALDSSELVEVVEVVVVVVVVSAPVEESPDPDEEEEEDEDTGGLEDGEGCGELVDEEEDAESDAEVDDDELESPDPSASRTPSIKPLFAYACVISHIITPPKLSKVLAYSITSFNLEAGI
jgi:hypothetical protein